MADHEKRAIVIGGGVAGLLAARVLSERFAQVTVLEREPAEHARAEHVYGVLAGGVSALEALFPGFSQRARERGGRCADVGLLSPWSMEGVPLPRMETGLAGLLMARTALQRLLRELVLQDAHVELRQARVEGLLGNAFCMGGVWLAGQRDPLPADLVVDASGYDSPVPRWLRGFGLQPPSEERVRVDLRCTQVVVTRDASSLAGSDGLVYTPSAPTPRGATVLALDDARYGVSLFGYLGAQATPSYRAMIEFARGMPDRALYALLRAERPLGEPSELRYPGSVRHRYDRMRHRPRGLLAIGDALCAINPAYGHGTTLAALQAQALRRALSSGSDPQGRLLPQCYFSESARIVDVPWSMVAGADLEFGGARATQPPPHPSIRAYFKRALRAASLDRALALAVYRVMHLVDPPSALFAPELVSLVLGQREPPLPASPRLRLVPDGA